MESLGEVRRYLEAMNFGKPEGGGREGPGWPFITISRQPGAGGHSLAAAVLAEMSRREAQPFFRGWQMFDDALCRLVVESPQLRVSLKSLLGEEYHSEIQDFIARLITWSSPQNLVLRRLFHAVRSLAAAGKVVIVGRGAACLTRGFSGGIHIRLVASEESRLESLCRRLGLERRQAARRMREMSAGRAALVRDYFRQDIEDPLLYDAVWNVDRVPLQDIAAWLADAVEQKAARRLRAGAPA